MGIKWPGPLLSKDEPRTAEHKARKTDPRRVRLPTGGLEPRSVRTDTTGALDLQKPLISGSRAGTAANPRNLQMKNVGGTQLSPRSGPTNQGFRA
jgi:hypothetical protein